MSCEKLLDRVIDRQNTIYVKDHESHVGLNAANLFSFALLLFVNGFVMVEMIKVTRIKIDYGTKKPLNCTLCFN